MEEITILNWCHDCDRETTHVLLTKSRSECVACGQGTEVDDISLCGGCGRLLGGIPEGIPYCQKCIGSNDASSDNQG